MKYFLKSAGLWLCGKNTLSSYSNSPTLAIDAVKISTSLPSPQNVNKTTLLPECFQD